MRKPECVAAIVAAALALGCGSTSESTCDECDGGGCGDAGGDSDTDADTDTDTNSELECPDPIAEACPEAVDPLPLIFSASDFGEGTVFVDVAPWSVLAERDAGGTRTISVISCRGADGSGLQPCDASTAIVAAIDVPVDTGPHAVALAANDYYVEWGLPPYLAVLCDDVSCALYGADLSVDPPETDLAAIPDGGLPATSAVHGLWRDDEGDVACAYGDGIHCFDGEAWTSPIPASAGDPLFNAMATTFGDAPGAIAVGDSQRVALSGFPAWESWYGSDFPDWLAVAAYADGYAIAGEGGLLALKAGAGWVGECAFAEEDVVELHALDESGMEWSQNASIGATASGRVFRADGPATAMQGACYTGQVVGANPRAVTFRCGIEANLFLMTEAELYGTTDCAVD
jgi:hypothetical protein